MNKNAVNKNLLLMKWIDATGDAFFVIPVLALYYIGHKNMTMQEFFITEAVMAVSLVIMEIPSGWLSDVWKRKSILVVGSIIYTIGAFVIWLAQDFLGIAISQALMGIGASLISGTDSAIVYESLLANGRENEYRKYEGERQAWRLYAVSGCAVIGGWLYTINPQLPVIITAIVISVSAILAMFIVEPPRVKEVGHKNPFVDMAKTLKYAFHGHKEVACIILFSAVLLSVTLSSRFAEQAYLIALDIQPIWFGIVTGIALLTAAISGKYAHQIEEFVGVSKSVYLMFGITVIALIVAAIQLSYLGIFMTILISGVFGYATPIINDAVNRRVGSGRRATILSSMGLSRRLVFVWLGPLTGYLIDTKGVQVALMVLAIFIAVGGLLAIRCLVKNKVI